jgi:hypothetical protein
MRNFENDFAVLVELRKKTDEIETTIAELHEQQQMRCTIRNSTQMWNSSRFPQKALCNEVEKKANNSK